MFGAANIILMTRSVLLEKKNILCFTDKLYENRQGEAQFCFQPEPDPFDPNPVLKPNTNVWNK